MRVNKVYSNKPVLLIFPPAAYPERPGLGLASIAGFLRSKKVDVVLEDFNIGAYHFLLNPDRIDFYSKRINDHLMNPKIPDNWKLKAAKTLAKSQYLKNNLSKGIESLQSKNLYYTLENRYQALDLIREGTKMISRAYFGVKWDWGSFKCGYRSNRSHEIMAAALDPESTPFTEYYQQRIQEKIIPHDPVLIGISINYKAQIIPAFRLLKIIKEFLPGTHCTVGGAIFSRLVKELPEAKALFRVCDSFVVNEGESSLWLLYQALINNRPLQDIPNLVYRQGKNIHVNHFRVENLAELPAPSFDGFPLNRYLIPEIVLPLETSRGCYWSKCTFCNMPEINFGRVHRCFPIKNILDTIEKLCRKHNSRWITFGDESMPPETLKELSLGIIKRKIPLEWHALVRLDSYLDRSLLKLMAKAGCRALYVGLESAHPRILKLINKNINLEKVLEILKDCKEFDIHLNIFWFVGFPTETKDEAETTYNFLIKNLKNNEYAWLPALFTLYKHSLIEREPERFGVKIIRTPQNDLALEFDYSVESGMETADNLRLDFIKRLQGRRIALEPRYDIAYLLYQSHYNQIHPPFTPKENPNVPIKYLQSNAIPRLTENTFQEIKAFIGGRESVISVLSSQKSNSVIIKGLSREVDFWLKEIDGIRTVKTIKQKFQQTFGQNSPWLDPYLKLIDLGMVEFPGLYPELFGLNQSAG